MKKAPPVRLSLRKLFIAMLAVGPIAILPSPLLALVPAAQPFTISVGNASWSGSSTTQGTIGGITDRSVLIWGAGNFTIDTGDTFTFQFPTGGTVLNKVGYTTSGAVGTPDNATINGILNSNGRVIVLANGNISVGGGATINTGGGLLLSTLAEADQFNFTASGNLALNGASTGNITIGGVNTLGGTTGPVSVAGNLAAYSGLISPNNLSVTGDLILNQSGAGTTLNVAGSGGPTSVTGNLTVVTSNGAVTQVGNLSVGNLTTISSGSGAITLGQSVGILQITSGGSGYTAVPTVTISGGGGTGASATAALSLGTIGVGAGGTGYTSAPTVTIAAPPAGGTQATATATIATGAVTAITITNPGSGYTSAPAVTFSASGGSGATATSNAVVGGFTITPGTGYTSAPAVTFGAVTGATVAVATSTIPTNNFSTVQLTTSTSATLSDANDIVLGASTIGQNLNVLAGANITTSGVVATAGSVSLTSNGVGNISYANGSSAGVFNASAANGAVTANTVGNLTVGNVSAGGGLNSIAINNGGSGYTAAPTITITGGGGTGAAATAIIDGTGTVVGISITSPGSGYTSAPTIGISGGGTNATTTATATAALAGTGVLLLNPASTGGNYTVAPSVTFAGGGGTGAAATPILSPTGAVIGYTITSAGTGYTSAPTVTVSGGTLAPGGAIPFSGASTQLVGTGVGLITGGTGGNYTSTGITPPTVTLSAPQMAGGVQATAVPTFNSNGGINGFTITNPGSGYISAPTITVTGGVLGTAAAAGNATAALTPTSIGAVTSSAGGSGYTIAPTVTLSGGGGAGAVVTAAIAAGAVTSPLTVSSAGAGFTSAPTVTITGGGANPITALQVALPSTGNAVTLTTTGSLTFDTGSVRGSSVTANGTSILSGATPGAILSGGLVTLNATANNVVLPAVTAGSLAVTAPGSITQAGTSVVTTTSNATAAFTAGATSDVSLPNANVLTNATLSLTGNNITVNNTRALIVGSTVAGGNLTINTAAAPTQVVPSGTTTITVGTGNVTFGAGGGASSQNITVGGALNVTTSLATITDDDDATIRVFGALNLVTNNLTLTTNTTTNGGNIVLDSSTGASGRGSATLGQINANAGTANVTVNETQTANFGNVTANVLTTNSVSANILFSGNVTVGAITANANTGGISQTAPITTTAATQTSSFRSNNSFGTVLDNTSNSFAGQVTVTNGGNNIIVAGSNFTLAAATSVTSGNLSISTVGGTANRILIAGGNAVRVTANSVGQIVVNGGTFQNLTLSSSSSAADSIIQTGTTNNTNGAYAIAGNSTFTSNGTLTLSSAGGITLTSNIGTSGTTNNLTNVVLNGVSGTTAVSANRNMVLSGNATGDVYAFAGGGPVTNPWNMTLGNLNVKSLTANVYNGNNNNPGDGSSGTITQSAGSSIHVENLLSATTFNNNIILANNGNSSGRVELSSGTADITYVEDATIKLGGINTTGNATLTSRFGGIIEDQAANVVINVNGTSSVLSVNAGSGSVALGNTTHTAGTTTGNLSAVNIVATGSGAITSTGNLVLGPTAVNSLTVTANNISQSGPLNIFGLSTFNATNSITLTNAANNFGPLSLTSMTNNQAIAVTEASTLNLRAVTMPAAGGTNGTFTANSIGGDIIDTGLGGVKLGGATGGPGNGIVSLIAPAGNIIIDDPTSDLPTNAGVVFNSGNVTLSVLGAPGSTLVLGAAGTPSAATGNLTVTSALGNVGSAGSLTAGNAFFQSAAGNISIGTTPGTTTGFGTVKFIGNQIIINETGNMDIVTGSQAFGPAQLISGGSISIVDAGGVVSFGNNVSLQAAGDVTLKLTQVVGTLRVSHTGTANLSALSKSGDLNGKDPVDLGTGAYVAPNP